MTANLSLAAELLKQVEEEKQAAFTVKSIQETAAPNIVDEQPSSRPALFRKWRPKKWEVNYEQIVILSTLGRSHRELAEQFGFTPQHISNIVQCPEASATRRIVLEKLRTNAADKIPAHLDDLADKAVQRLRDLLNDDQLFKEHPFAVVDRGMAVLKGINRLKGDGPSGPTIIGNQTNFNKPVMFPLEIAREISDGLKFAREARQLNPVEIVIEEKEKKNGTEG